MRTFRWTSLLLPGIIAIYLAFTAYQLRQLPGEWYGDISIEHREVTAILNGEWTWRFNLSAGPAYHYVVAAFAGILGPNYTTYKIASLVTGLAAVLMTYLLGKALAGRRVGLLAALVAALSFWLVVFARLGSSPQILTPVLSAGAVYFLLRYSATRRWYNAAASMVFAGMGIFTYPSTFFLPLVILALIGWQLVFHLPRAIWWRAALLAAGILLPFVVWFNFTEKTNPAFAQGGYVSGKVFERGVTPLEEARTFGKNMLTALGEFQWTGDRSFRTNDSGKPLLDPLSGGLMDIGLVVLFLNPRLRRYWLYLVVPIVILVMPSADPGLPPLEIPSASRTLSAAPFVFVLAALGLDAVWAGAQALLDSPGNIWERVRGWARGAAKTPGENTMAAPVSRAGFSPANGMAAVLLAMLVVVIGYFNITRYFGDYAWGLPEHNQAWGWLIARYIDQQPAGTQVKITACCWGERQDPDPESIFYVLKDRQGRGNLLGTSAYLRSCQDLLPGKTYLIIAPPNEADPHLVELRGCFPQAQGEMHSDGLGKPAFYALLVSVP